jgi:type II secretory pathway component GspD/PulD (secretin)
LLIPEYLFDASSQQSVTPLARHADSFYEELLQRLREFAFNEPIGGITEPVIGQRKVEHEIRLKDGEVSLLGGMLEQQNMRPLTGIPGLSQIPILKYLFGQKNTDVMDSEIVVRRGPVSVSCTH